MSLGIYAVRKDFRYLGVIYRLKRDCAHRLPLHQQGEGELRMEAITKQKSWQPQIKKIVKYFCLSSLIYSPGAQDRSPEWWINPNEKWSKRIKISFWKRSGVLCGIGLSWNFLFILWMFCRDFWTLCKTFHLYLSELVGMLVVFNGFSGAICSGDFGQYDCKCYKCY